jgi:hypothetical protein
VGEILAAMDLNVSALFPDRPEYRASPERRPFPAMDVLRAIALEALVVVASVKAIRAGEFQESEWERLFLAAERIQDALAAAGVTS